MARSKTAWRLAESVGTSPLLSHRGARQPADPRSPRPTVLPRAERRLGDGQDWSRRRREAVAGGSRAGGGAVSKHLRSARTGPASAPLWRRPWQENTVLSG